MKMKKMNIKSLCAFIVLLVISPSCKKYLSVAPPVTQLVTTSVFTSDATAIATQLAVYAKMQIYPWTIDEYNGLSSDELATAKTDPFSLDLYGNLLNAKPDASTISIWPNAYSFIYQENAILEALPASAGISNVVKQQLTGEAEFTRAFWYFYLVNFYGDVPLITSTNYKVNSAMSRTTSAQVYKQIIADLNASQSHLSSNYLDGTDTTITTDRVRPTIWAASAMLARVYLFDASSNPSYYDSAEAQATRVINNPTQYSLTGLDAVFLKNSNEAIWQILPQSGSNYTNEGFNFILTSPPATSTSGITTSNVLLNAFELGDNRRTKWVGSYSSNGNTWYFPYKYKGGRKATSVTEYSMVLRLGEQYLIRAEARAQQGNISGALADLNVIRNRAGLSNYSGLMDKASLILVIQHERQVELFSEGFRWLDLKRTGMVNSVMSIVSPQKGGATWDPNQALYPIPVTDIQNDPNLAQNHGY